MLFTTRQVLKFFTKKLPFSYLLKGSSGTAWDRAENDLLNYNKTVITIVSSSLVLSFSVIKLTDIHINFNWLVFSWIMLVVALLTGIILLFAKYVASLTDGIFISHDKEVIDKEEKNKLLAIYFISLATVYYLSVVELISFGIGLISLLVTMSASFK